MQRPGRGGGDKGHRDRYYEEQKKLRQLVDKADALGCHYTDEANSEKNRPHTYPAPRY